MAVRKNTATQSGITVSDINPATGKQGKTGLWFLSVDGKPAGNFREYPDRFRYGLAKPGGLMGQQIIGTKADYPTPEAFGQFIGQQVATRRTEEATDKAKAKEERAKAKAKAKATPEATEASPAS